MAEITIKEGDTVTYQNTNGTRSPILQIINGVAHFAQGSSILNGQVFGADGNGNGGLRINGAGVGTLPRLAISDNKLILQDANGKDFEVACTPVT